MGGSTNEISEWRVACSLKKSKYRWSHDSWILYEKWHAFCRSLLQILKFDLFPGLQYCVQDIDSKHSPKSTPQSQGRNSQHPAHSMPCWLTMTLGSLAVLNTLSSHAFSQCLMTLLYKTIFEMLQYMYMYFILIQY